MSLKCVIVIDQELPLGLIANTAAVLSLTLGKRIDGIIGHDLIDSAGHVHSGITTTPISILKGNKDGIREIRKQLYDVSHEDLLVVDFCNAAQTTKTYDDYENKLKQTPADDLVFLGIAIYGPAKIVNKYTGSMPLLR